MKRREFLGVLGGVATAWPAVVRAQQSGPLRRVGFLRVGSPPPAFIDAFRQGMRERGLIEEQHFIIEYGLAKSAAQIPDVATELVTSQAGRPCRLWNAVRAAGEGRCGSNSCSIRGDHRSGRGGACDKPRQARTEHHWNDQH